MPPEDQGHLTDIAEEGRCTLDKYGTHFDIDAPTTIIATANPYYTKWNSGSSVSKDEIPVLRTLIDRCDQLYAFRDAPSELEVKDYTNQKTKIRKRRPHNYNFLRKFLIYAKSISPEMNRDAEYRLNEFWAKARLKDAATNRTYDSIFRLAEAQAKLNLSKEITDDIASTRTEAADA
jgi:DNA replicative helicase MCM subunit Mcm2 (Cdc46/Mcm family)